MDRDGAGARAGADSEAAAMTVGETITGVIAIGLLVYLTYALLRPERF